jgi:hypothetical protein
MDGLWPWITLALLGAYHGINPAMGWLFAVGLGVQDQDRRSVLRALPPIAIGHELAIAVVAALVVVLGVVADPKILSLGAAVVLIAFGVFRFVKPRLHPRWTTMRVNRKELTWWSFLMSSAHGAGLMVAPVLLGTGASATAHAHGGHDHGTEAATSPGHLDMAAIGAPETLLAITVHVGAMLLVMAIVALLVYEKLGVKVLRKAWLNSDQVWAGAFIVAGVVTLVT